MPSKYHARIGELTGNLVHLYKTVTDDSDVSAGMPWYPRAHSIMRDWSDSYGVSIATAACVTAAISPQCDWNRNLIIADEVLAGAVVPSIGGALHANIAKARAIYRDKAGTTMGYFKSGPKVASFAANLAGDYSLVTVDTHAVQAALCDVEVTLCLKWNVYEAFASAYVNAAKRVKLEPAFFQAVIWHTWKRIYPPAKKRSVRTQWTGDLGEC